MASNFVWVKDSIGQTVAQIWHDDACKTLGENHSKIDTIVNVKLSVEEAKLSIAELAIKYPIPVAS